MDFRVDLAGLRLKNPLIVASGVLGVSVGLMKRAEDAGIAAITMKTATLQARQGHPNPVVYEVDCGLLNSMGLPNPGAREMGFILEEAKRILSVPIIASVGAATPEESAEVAKYLMKADAFELNASCPHVKGLGAELISDPEAMALIVGSLKNTGLPVLVKLSAHADWLHVAGRVLDAGADGFVAINTLKGMAIDVYARKPVLGGVYGGLSGPSIHPVAVRVVYELHREYPDVPIVGVGGVEKWTDAVEFILAGARAVGVATALRKGFQVVDEILRGIALYMRENSFSSINEIVGLAHRC